MDEKFPQEKDLKKKRGAKDIPSGGIITCPGSSQLNKTGSWKSFRPVWDKSKCTNCMICVVYCPEDCIPSKDGKRGETDLEFCKGCGICAKECPVKAISMEEDK